MSHLSGHCTCGRVIHYPKGSTYGSTWKCHNCGKTWHIARTGRPLHNHHSKAPNPSSDSDLSGLGTGILLVGGLVALAVAPTTCLVGAGIAGGVWAYKHLS